MNHRVGIFTATDSRVAALRCEITLNRENRIFFTESRVRLLEAIDSEHSLSGAVRRIPMSYKTAWESINCMQMMSASPLVMRIIGGKKGGGTILTAYGRTLVAQYRSAQRGCQRLIDGIFSPSLTEPPTPRQAEGN